ncbi:hypothetical protein HAX54_039120, partial [Datura stramonium]|nr:hypothetical protein [Datura stramonium]
RGSSLDPLSKRAERGDQREGNGILWFLWSTDYGWPAVVRTVRRWEEWKSERRVKG